MSRYRHETDNARAHILSLWGVIGLLAIMLFGVIWGWSKTPQDLRLHLPPDLSEGVTLKPGEVPKPNVYTFGYYMWQQLNRWPSDGAKDFPKNIFAYSAYLTPRFRAQLTRDMKTRARAGELVQRVRALYEAPEASYEDRRVDILGPGAWAVWIDVVIEESVNGMAVKHTLIRYPLRVVRYDVDREANPWGLALDGFIEPGPAKVPETGEKAS